MSPTSARPSFRSLFGRLAGCLVGVLLTGLLAACGTSSGTGDQGYVDGSGTITRLPAHRREPVGRVAGRTLEGRRLDLSSLRGHVVVVNVWGTWCPPCRAEAGRLARAARRLQPQGVRFVGINTRDASPDQGLAFQRSYAVPYPSLFDPSGRTLLSFRGAITPSAIPSTVVLDRHGRVAASVIGEITGEDTLPGLVDDVAEGRKGRTS